MSHFLMIAFNIGCGGLNVFIQEDVDSNQAQFSVGGDSYVFL